ncbi:MAG: NUDIX domain-containing protein [Candidatus Thermoplasmatota archaeon]|nr:NUDIX domain-containing protein [Candidatus Thermoplasmatota archaeon]
MIEKSKIQAVIYRPSDGMEFLLLHYTNPRSYWENLTANVEDGESDVEAIIREMQEECGIKPEMILDLVYLGLSHYEKAGTGYREHIYGVKVKHETVVDISGNPEMEHDKFKWARPGMAISMLKWQHMKDAVRDLSELCLQPIFS